MAHKHLGRLHGKGNYLRIVALNLICGSALNLRRGEIGIILFLCSTLSWLILIEVMGRLAYQLYIWSSLRPIVIYGPTLALTITGLALYINGRREFLNHVKGSKITSVSLVILSLILMAAFSFLGWMSLGSWAYYSKKVPQYPLTLGESAEYALSFVWCGLVFILGVIWLIDGIIISSKVDLPHLKQEINLESQTKIS